MTEISKKNKETSTIRFEWKNSPIFSFKNNLCFFGIATTTLLADLASKFWALRTLGTVENPDPIIIIDKYLRFILVENPGAVAGLGSGKTSLLLGASMIALLFVGWMFITSEKKNWQCHLSLGMILGGATGNMYDRIFNNGKVVDFIEVNLHFRFFDPWPTFNIADMWLCIGVFLLLIQLLKNPQK